MRLFALFWILGLAAAHSEWRWETGKEYVYQYRGRLITGIPELSHNHFSGIAINCTVHIQARNSDAIMLKISDPKYVQVDRKLEVSEHGISPENWRELLIPESREPISEELVSILIQPVFLIIRNGEIRSVAVYKNEPVWSINFKKALALQIQTKADSSSSLNLENNRLHAELDGGETYWKVKEQGLDGTCDVTYQIRELPEYMIMENPDLVPYPEACSEKKYYSLTKTRDTGNCEKTSYFAFIRPGHYDYELTGNNLDAWSRSSSTRYIACGSRGGRLTLQSIVNEAELNQDLFGIKSERFVTGTLQVWHLKEVRPGQEIYVPKNMVVLESMLYKYIGPSLARKIQWPQELSEEERLKMSQEGVISSTLHHNLQVPTDFDALISKYMGPNPVSQIQQWEHSQEEALKRTREEVIPKFHVKNPRIISRTLPHSLHVRSSMEESDISSEEIKPQIKNLVRQALEDLVKGEEIQKKEIPMKVLSISRGLGLLTSVDELRSLYQELKSEFQRSEEDLDSLKNIFFDTLLMSGTPQSIGYLKEVILSDELSKSQISLLFIWMPHYIMIPNKEVLTTLFEMVSSEKVRECSLLYNSAIMGYSLVLQNACLSPHRKNNHPVAVFGEFCNPESEIVTKKWIPYLLHDLKNNESTQTRKNEIIISLAMMSHKSIFGELIPYIEGTVEGANTNLNRLLALYALSNSAKGHQSVVLPIFNSILSNPAEVTEMRIAAFNAILRCDPPMSVMHKIASLTWTEPNQEVLKVINSAFASLDLEARLNGNDEGPSIMLARKASLVYPLIKKSAGIFPSSGSIFTLEYLKGLGVGYETSTSWVASNNSYFPLNIYTQLTYFMDQLKYTPITVGARLEGAKSLYEELKKWFSDNQFENLDDESEDSLHNLKQQLHVEWMKVIQELGLKERQSGPIDGLFFLRLYESAPLFLNMDKLTPKKLRERILPMLKNPRKISEKICGSHPLNLQHTIDAAPQEFFIPSDMGFPINIEAHKPMVFSIRGKIDIDCTATMPSVHIKARTVYTSQLVGWVGTINPFKGEDVVTGIDQYSVVNLPVEMSLKVDLLSHKVSFNLKPVPTSEGKPLYFLHHHVRPFTVAKKSWDLTPLTLHNNIRYISSGEQLKKVEGNFGDLLGLKLKSVVHTESKYTDLKSVLDVLKLYNYNPINMLRFHRASPALTETGKPSIRRHEYCLIIDPTESATKEIQVDFRLGFGETRQQQDSQEQEMLYHNIRLKAANRLDADFSDLYEVQSSDIESTQIHPRRQMKIRSLLQDLNVESGKAMVLLYTTTLKGSRPISWTYTLSAVVGQEKNRGHDRDSVKQKWNIHLENDSRSNFDLKQVCIKGEVDVPILPTWSIEELTSSLIDFKYVNTIAFGRESCAESSVRVTGNARVSHHQRQESLKSSEGVQCLKELEEGEQQNGLVSEICERLRHHLKTVDEVEFKIDYHNVPEEWKKFEDEITKTIKFMLWPYLKSEKISNEDDDRHQSQHRVLCHIRFHHNASSFDLMINGPHETVRFSKIRIPFPIDKLLPMRAGENNALLAVKSIVGDSVAPVCRINPTTMDTFDNRSVSFHIDYCFHLLSGDCSNQRRFGILTRTMKPGNRRELRVFLGNLMMIMTPSRLNPSPPNYNVTIYLESEKLTLPTNTWTTITYKGNEYGSIYRSTDNVIQVKSPQYFADFLYDGNLITIYGHQELKDDICGLCGNYGQQTYQHLTGPGQCIYSKPELQAASFRVSKGLMCDSSLPGDIQEQLEREKEQCVQFQEIPTKISKSLKAQTGSCTVLKHIIIRREGQVCFSRSPVVECGPACKVVDGQMVKKNVTFICLPEGRLADRYIQKAYDGQNLPELRSMENTFDAMVEQPRRCESTL